MDNIYLNSLPYNELLIAEEDFTYGNKVKCSIPSLIKPLKHRKAKPANSIVNRDTQLLGINTSVKLEDTIDIIIPRMCAKNPNNPEAGKKGDKFAISFIGGGQSKYVVSGRVE